MSMSQETYTWSSEIRKFEIGPDKMCHLESRQLVAFIFGEVEYI